MLKVILVFLAIGLLGILAPLTLASPYGAKICNNDPRLKCVTVGKNHEWQSIRNNNELMDLVKRLNRVNVGLYGTVAIPNNLADADLLKLAPLPLRMPAAQEKLLVIDIDKLAWAAYAPSGMLLRWGPIAPGKAWCADVGEACGTVTGKFAIYSKQGAGCRSRKFPRPNGGAAMPYCSFFHGGYAVHAGQLPGAPASHGCVRTLKEDAKWLSEDFLDIGTRVFVKPYKL